MNEEMRVYKEVKEYLDESLAKDNEPKKYQLLLRIQQMYRELYQLKLGYKRVIQEDFKEELINGIYSARQTLYNYNHKSYKKEDILQGINFAIDTLNELINLESKGEE